MQQHQCLGHGQVGNCTKHMYVITCAMLCMLSPATASLLWFISHRSLRLPMKSQVSPVSAAKTKRLLKTVVGCAAVELPRISAAASIAMRDPTDDSAPCRQHTATSLGVLTQAPLAGLAARRLLGVPAAVRITTSECTIRRLRDCKGQSLTHACTTVGAHTVRSTDTQEHSMSQPSHTVSQQASSKGGFCGTQGAMTRLPAYHGLVPEEGLAVP